MKASDIIGFKFTRSLLGSDPSGIDVTRDGPGEYKAFDRSSTEEAPIAVLRVEGGVITSLEIEEGNDIGPAATALIKALCDDADAANRILLIHPESMVGGVKALRFMESFGFMRGKDEFLVRRPGAALPYSVMF